jgi:hypothetical protein
MCKLHLLLNKNVIVKLVLCEKTTKKKFKLTEKIFI